LVAIAGAVFAVLGLGGSSPIDIKIGDDFKLKTEVVGFGVMALALLGIVGIVKVLPGTVVPFGGPSTPTRNVLPVPDPVLVGLGSISLVAAIIIAIVDH